MTEPAVAFLGLGRMGAPMAMRLLAADCSVTVWNRSAARTAALAELGARVAATPAEALSEGEFAILMLADGEAVGDVLTDPRSLDALRPGSVVIDMSSIPPARARAHAELLAEQGVGHLDAPVSGGVLGASKGSLTIMVGGDGEVLARATPVLQALGQQHHLGPAGSGQVAKCVNQLIVGITIGAVAEGLLLASASGVDPERVREALTGGFADSRILREHGRRMLERDFAPGGSVALQLKDLRTALALAGKLRLPLTERVTELFEDLERDIGAEHDHSALLLGLERAQLGQWPPAEA
jgi:2-hydroxy-3-oxopropionate reductase